MMPFTRPATFSTTASEQEQGAEEDRNHRKGVSDLHGRADQKADPCGQADAPGACDITMRAQLAKDRPHEWPEHHAGEAEREAQECPQRRADHCSLAGADT